MADPADILGFILAGGQSRRMGGSHKFLKNIAGQPLLQHVIDRARPQCGPLVLNCNEAPLSVQDFGLPVVPDFWPGAEGPLAGILTGLAVVRKEHPDCQWVMTFAADSPLFPEDCVATLKAAAEAAKNTVAICYSGGRPYPVMGLWHVSAYDALYDLFVEQGERRPHRAAAMLGAVPVAFEMVGDVDPFFNANRPDDLAILEQALSSRP